MPTSVAIDEGLLKEAMELGNHKSAEEAVIAALRDYVSRHNRLAILDLAGTIDYDEDYDSRELRKGKRP
jgi:hypothetical protein